MSQSKPANPSVFYASQSGMPTLDHGDGGGNPFASAFVELLDRPSLTYAEFCSDLVGLTKMKSGGFQVPEVLSADAGRWRLKPISGSAKRVAIVLVYSDYSKSGVASLEGAARDLVRVAMALRRAGFDVREMSDPTKNEFSDALQTLSKQSENAEAAIIYLTGHGFECDGQVYLMPNDFPFGSGCERLAQYAINIDGLQEFLKAKMMNGILFGGCRSHMRTAL